MTVADVGPGWPYYLDRLAAAESGADAHTITWGEQYTDLGEPYAKQFGSGSE